MTPSQCDVKSNALHIFFIDFNSVGVESGACVFHSSGEPDHQLRRLMVVASFWWRFEPFDRYLIHDAVLFYSHLSFNQGSFEIKSIFLRPSCKYYLSFARAHFCDKKKKAETTVDTFNAGGGKRAK